MSWLAFNVRRSPYLSLGISSDAPRLYNVGFNGFNGDTDVGDARARARGTRVSSELGDRSASKVDALRARRRCEIAPSMIYVEIKRRFRRWLVDRWGARRGIARA